MYAPPSGGLGLNLAAPSRPPATPYIAVFLEPPIPGINPIICDTPKPGQPLLYNNTSNQPIFIPNKTTFKCLAVSTDIPPIEKYPNRTIPLTPLSNYTASDLNINTTILSTEQINNLITICSYSCKCASMH